MGFSKIRQAIWRAVLGAGALALANGLEAEWTHVPIPAAAEVTALGADPSSSGVVYAGVQAIEGGAVVARIYRSEDAGATWERADAGFGGTFVRSLAVDPAEPSVVYAAGSGGLFRSADGGRSWAALGWATTFPVRSFALDPVSRTTLYVGTFDRGVWKSTDGGATWRHASVGLAVRINAIAVNAHGPSLLYAAAPEGVYRSVNGGESWSQVLPGFAQCLALDPADPSIVWAGGAGRVSRSADDGTAWTSRDFGSSQAFVRGIVALPDSRTAIAAGDEGVSRTGDAGETWSKDIGGLRDPGGIALASGGAYPLRVYIAAGDAESYRADHSAEGCADSRAALCLAGRFQVTASWLDEATGERGTARARSLASDSGGFWFFSSGNVELIVKALDGRALNGHHWLFYGALSHVRYELQVVDTATGRQRTYVNPHGTMASFADTQAFAGAP